MDDQERLTKVLADRYAIEREIGVGGMATVYLARDLKHNRNVAVKVLDPALAETLGAERFLREIETAANLTHPHILPLFDSGEADGFLYYVMPYMKGESLRARLTKEKQLPVEDAVQITREIADALAHAHEQGIVHRDVKPANIMLEAGHAVLADFGVAQAVAEAKDQRLTRTGTSLGTPAYMSPEQATGERDLDGRSDQYSLGCVLFEMLAGHPPFSGAQVEAVIRQHIVEEPPSVTQVRPTVAKEVATVINRALAKSPADRFRTTGEMAVALALTTSPVRARSKNFPKLLWMGLGPLALVVAVYFAFFRGGEGAGPPEEAGVESPHPTDNRPSLAVIPFDDLSPNGEYGFFANGVQQELTSKLSGISSLQVKGRTSLDQYRDPSKRPSARQIGTDLGVDYLIAGSARVGGDSIRISIQLINAQTENNLWSDDFDELYSAENYYRLEAQIAQQIAFQLRTAISPDENEWLEAIPTGNLEALEAFLRGLEFFRSERQRRLVVSDFRSRQLFDQAIDLDPNFGLAHAYLALTLTYSSAEGRYERARRAAERALSLAGEVPEARIALSVCLAETGDRPGAARQLEMALQFAPDNTFVLLQLASTQAGSGDFDTAIQTLLRAEQLDPRDPIIPQSLGELFRPLHRWDDALEAFAREAALSETPPPREMWVRALIHLARGEYERARTAISEVLDANPSYPTNLIPNNDLTVVLRFMTPEERQVSLEAWMLGLQRYPEEDLSCAATELACIRKAIHEREVGSDAQAQILWDSLRVFMETDSPLDGIGDYLYRALIHMEVGEEEAALEMARTGVRLFAPEGCRTSRATTVGCTMAARVLARFGEPDEAIDLVEDMLPTPSWLTVHLLEIDPIWDPLRDHPRFRALLERYADDVEH